MPEQTLAGNPFTATSLAEQPIARATAQLTAFVGRTLRGPLHQPIIVRSFADFQRQFGGLWQPSPLSYAVEHFFEQGGRAAVVVRVANAAAPIGGISQDRLAEKEFVASLGLATAPFARVDGPEDLALCRVDLAVGYVPQLRDKIRRERLFEEHYVCMTRPDHPLGRRGALTLKEFLSARHVLISSMGSGHQQLEHALAEHGVDENVALRMPHFMVAPLILAGTDLVVSLPSRAAEVWTRLVKIKVHPFPIRIPSFEVSLYWHPRVENDAANRWLRDALLELFGSE